MTKGRINLGKLGELLMRLRAAGVPNADEEIEQLFEIDADAWRLNEATKGVDKMPAATEVKVPEPVSTLDLTPLTDMVKALTDSMTALTDLVKAQAEVIGTLQTSITAQAEQITGMQTQLTETTTELKGTADKAAQAIETADAVTAEIKKSAGKPLTPEMQGVADTANGVVKPLNKRFPFSSVR